MVLSDKTFEQIRQLVLSHKIAPGDRVNIDALARELNVSQTPIREALARLESEGLVTKEPMRGYTASALLTVEQLDGLFEFRELIEPWAAGRAAETRSRADIARINSELDAGKAAEALDVEAAYAAMSEHDARFHELIAEISGSEFVREAFVRTHCHLHLYRLYQVLRSHLNEAGAASSAAGESFRLYYESSGGFLAFSEHQRIAKAIIDGDATAAENLMREHIRASRERFVPSIAAIHQRLAMGG